MYAKITYGAPGSLLIKLIIIINNVGMCCAYFRIFGETAKNLADVFIDENSFWGSQSYIYILIVFVIMGFLIFKDNLDSLKSASFLGVMGISTFFICLIIIFVYKSTNDLIPKYDETILYPRGGALDFIGALPTVCLAFTFQNNLFPVYFTLKKRTKSEMMKAAKLAIGFCFSIFTITGLLGYFMYRNNLKGTVLDSFLDDIKLFKSNDKFMIVILVIINISFLLSSTMSIPLMFFTLKNNFILSIIFCKKKFGKKPIPINNDELLLNTVDYDGHKLSMTMIGNPQESNMSSCVKYFIIVILYIMIGAITILVPELRVVS